MWASRKGTVICAVGCCLILLVAAVIAYFAVSKYNSSSCGSSTPTDYIKFPVDFKIGCASSAYQVEGAWNESGKGENSWDYFTHNHPDQIAGGGTGDVACDSYHNYLEDVQMIKTTGFQTYRFSISWSRVIPNGCDNVTNPAGIAYYHNLIDELLANGIQPMVTLFHWDLPMTLQDLGGWTNDSTITCFLNYADIMFNEFGDKVKWWITMNEIFSMMKQYANGEAAPAGMVVGVSEYQCLHNMLRAHGKAYRLYEAVYKSTQQGKVGIASSSLFYSPLNSDSPDDQGAANRALQFEVGIQTHAIFSRNGDYPSIVKEIVYQNSIAEGRNSSRLPNFTAEEIEELKGSADFFGCNHYNTTIVKNGYLNSSTYFNRDAAYITEHSSPSPEGFRSILNWIKNQYDNPLVFVTENGFNAYNSDDFYDLERINNHYDYLSNLLKAIYEDGCKITGYTVWAIMDNFEWTYGYQGKYGLWHVDFNVINRTRTMKMSAYFFQKLMETRQLPSLPFSL